MTDNQIPLTFIGPDHTNTEREERKPIRFRKLSEIDIQLTVSRLCLIVILLTLVNVSILLFETFTGKCLYHHLNITEKVLLVRIK